LNWNLFFQLANLIWHSLGKVFSRTILNSTDDCGSNLTVGALAILYTPLVCNLAPPNLTEPPPPHPSSHLGAEENARYYTIYDIGCGVHGKSR